MIRRVLQVINSTELKLWQMAVAAAVPALLSVLWTEHATHEEFLQNERVSEVTEFRKASDEFDTLTGTYMANVAKNNAIDQASKDGLLANIRRQYSVLAVADNYLKPSDREVVRKYQGTLVKLSGQLQLASDIYDTRDIWITLSSSVPLRKSVDSELRAAAKLPVDRA